MSTCIYLHTYPARRAMLPAAGHGLHVHGLHTYPVSASWMDGTALVLAMPLVISYQSGSEEKVARRETSCDFRTHCDRCSQRRHSFLRPPAMTKVFVFARVRARLCLTFATNAHTSVAVRLHVDFQGTPFLAFLSLAAL